jgi:hypothetical protein
MNNSNNSNQPLIEAEIINNEVKTIEVSKFNFNSSVNKKKKGIKYALIAFVSIIVLTAGYFGLQYFIDFPMLNSINTSSKTNEKVILSSVKNPFHVVANSKTYYSENKSGQWLVDLGELEGENQIKYGGVLNIGPFKILSYKTKLMSTNRTFVKPKVEINQPQFVDNKEVSFDIKVTNNLIIDKIYNLDQIVYDKSKEINICNLKKDDKTSFTCKFAKAETNTIKTKFKIVDQYDNSITLDESKTEFVEPNNFACNQELIENEGKLTCKGNKDSKIEYEQKTYEYKANTDLVLQESIENGQFKKTIKVLDIHKISKEINLEANVDKDKLTIDMWSKKWNRISAMEGSTGKDVFAKLNRSVNVKVKYYNVWKGNTTEYTDFVLDSRIKLSKSRINANEETNFLVYYDFSYGYDPISDPSKNDYYLLDFTADNGKAIKFRCDFKFMCNQL